MMIRLALLTVTLLMSSTAFGGCNAPIAMADVAENYGGALVVDVLANDRDPDGDELSVMVTGTCPGATIEVRGSLIYVETTSHQPLGCTFGYRVTDVNGLVANSQIQLNAVTLGPIFNDGFEVGSTSRWSLTCISGCLPEPESWRH